MRLGGIYSFKNGQQVIETNFEAELRDIQAVVATIDALSHKTKVSKEKTMAGKLLYNPSTLNKAFKRAFENHGWQSKKILCEYPTTFYTPGYEAPKATGQPPYREIDFVKNGVGVEVQFGKYAFMVYNVCAKMTIFHNQGFIDVGVEIVPLKEFANEMSTSVSYFEQIVWDLENRGVADIDIPVLVLGITS